MSGPVLLPPNFLDEFNRLEERVDRLANSPQLTTSSVKEGAFTVLDNTGAVRARLGKDPATGAYGVESFDATGATIFDSNGARQVMSRIAYCDASPLNQAFTLDGVTNFDVAGASATFTLARPQELRLEFFWTALTSGAVGNFAYVSIYIGSNFASRTYQTGSIIYDKRNTGYLNSASQAFISAQPAGSYRVAMTVFGDSGQTLNLYQSHLDVYQLGA